MDIFIAWSGDGSASHILAEGLRDWLPSVLQRIKPFISSVDVEKGAKWQTEIASRLSKTQHGVLCLTPANRESTWLHFEAGALSKHVDTARVTALLFGLKPSEVLGPLSQFQHTSCVKEEIRILVQQFNRYAPEDGISEAKLNQTFDKWWQEFESTIGRADAQLQAERKGQSAPTRGTAEMLEELVENARASGRIIGEIGEYVKEKKREDISQELLIAALRNANPPVQGLFGLGKSSIFKPMGSLLDLAQPELQPTTIDVSDSPPDRAGKHVQTPPPTAGLSDLPPKRRK